jgi:hypothetical protein
VALIPRKKSPEVAASGDLPLKAYLLSGLFLVQPFVEYVQDNIYSNANDKAKYVV